MSYLVLARKWRPQRFLDVVGQTHVTKTLINAIEMDRVAHAFLFSGVRGVGKTSLARILAKSLNCKDGPTPNPCGVCDSCRAVTAGTAVDVIEIDGASNNSVEDIRNLRETIPFRPAMGKYKVYVIDEVHMLSTSAFNALLKTLEEPPSHVKFIFATTESHKIPVTILSRCQRYDFRRIPTSAIIERLAEILRSENILYEDGALSLIGREAEGSMRDALSTLDQVLASGSDKLTADGVADLLGVVERKVYYDLSRAVLLRDPKRCIEIIKETDRLGYDMASFSKGLLEHLRNLVVAGVCKGDKTVIDLPDEETKEILEQAGSVSSETLHRLFKHFAEAYESIVRSSHPKILLETAVARIADLGEVVSAHEILARLERLAKQGGAPTGNIPPGSILPGSVPPGSIPEDKAPFTGKGGPVSRGPAASAAASEAVPASMPAAPLMPSTESMQPLNLPQSNSQPLTPISKDVLQRLTEELKQDKPAMASILEYAGLETSDRGATFLFPREYASIAALAKERAPEMSVYYQQRLHREVRVEVKVQDGVTVATSARQRILEEDLRREKEERALSHPLIKQIQNEFSARVQSVQIIEEPQKDAIPRA